MMNVGSLQCSPASVDLLCHSHCPLPGSVRFPPSIMFGDFLKPGLEAKYRDAAAAAEAAMAQAEEYRQMLQSAGAEQNRAQVCGVFALV